VHLIKLESVDSTNLYAQHLITDWLAKDKTIVLALEQTSGKGQRGNTWDSTLNKGLYTSFIFFPEKMLAHEQFLFNKALSVGIAEYISKTIGVKAEIKWPNDILIQVRSFKIN
jgi:BirA family biotin operon repressor/biotin-[acetyl-CoA-carboxylase] ligase